MRENASHYFSETSSAISRVPVNESGERVHDETVNRLTVIANESYEGFARTLQTEFEEDFGIRFGKVEKIAFAKLIRRAEDGTETETGQDQSMVS